jgi:signal transduction histidine kinase
VRLSIEHDELRVDVADNGQGVPESEQQRIFERFQQGESTVAGGTGLGLPISQEIVRHFGGRLWVRSSPRHGATFSFTVPLQPIRSGTKAEA